MIVSLRQPHLLLWQSMAQARFNAEVSVIRANRNTTAYLASIRLLDYDLWQSGIERFALYFAASIGRLDTH